MFEFMKDIKNRDLKAGVKKHNEERKEQKLEHEAFVTMVRGLCDAIGGDLPKASLKLLDKSERIKFAVDDIFSAFVRVEGVCEDKKYVRAMSQTADYLGLVLTGLQQYM